jgi:hypothetical protein
MEELIEELKKANHERKTGGIFHSIEYGKIEMKVKNVIENMEINIKKPEFLHYNSIIDWYSENKSYLDSVNI